MWHVNTVTPLKVICIFVDQLPGDEYAMSPFSFLHSQLRSKPGCFCLFLIAIWSNATMADTLQLPVDVYRYSFAAAPELDSTYEQENIEMLISEVNDIWAAADIQWTLQSIQDRKISENDFPPLTGNESRTEIRKRFISASPNNHEQSVWIMALIHEFPVPAGGLYLPVTKTVYFAERTRGGPTRPIILAHELGHSLGLKHNRDSSNLMHSAAGGRDMPTDNATALSTQQITRARAQATEGPIEQHMPDARRRKRIIERLKSFDRDGDGVISIEDVPHPGQPAFQNIDTNGDGQLVEDELETYLNPE